MTHPPIDIVIPTEKSWDDLGPTTRAIAAFCGLANKYVHVTGYRGSAAYNRNRGLDAATSDPIIMLDDDIEGFPENWARDLLDTFAKYPNCVMLSPQLLRPDGSQAFMMGMDELFHPGGPPDTGVTVLPSQKLLTACVVIRRNSLRFDEGFVGSGYEDLAYCDDLRQLYPDGSWMVDHDVKVVHRNEMKNQSGEFYEKNRAYYAARKSKGSVKCES